MKASTVTKIKSLLFLAPLIVVGVFLTTERALANTELWNGTNDISATTNWSDNLNWINVTGGGGPGPNGNDVIFGDGAAATAGVVSGVVDNNSLNPLSLTFTNNSAGGNFHTILIPAGMGMTNANGLTVGIRLSTANSYVTTVGFVGGGTLVDVGSALQVDNSTTVGGSGLLPTLDLSGLTNFIYTNATGSITVAGTSSGSEARGSGQLNLAGVSNNITVNSINVALGTGNGGIGGTINLGTGTNIINVTNINLAAGKINNATIKFLGPTGGLRIRGLTGADSDRNVTMTLGNRSSSGSGNPTGTLNCLGGYPVNVKVNSITLGRSNQAGLGTGNLAFDTGIFDVTTINMAITSSTGGCTGSNTVSGGLLLVGNMSLVNQTGAGIGTGTLYINGTGTVICSNSIVKTTTAGVGNITMNGGSLSVSNSIGSAANAIDTLSIADSALTLPANLVAAAHATNLTAAGTANAINVSSLPSILSYPAQFPMIAYVNALGDNNTFVVGTLPGTFTGYISNNVGSLSIDIVITNGPALNPLKSISWQGAPTGDWTTNTGTLNWVTNGTSVNYNQGDTVTFNDTLTGTTNVNLTQALFPTSLTVNNSASNYLFTGVGKITGATGLTKTGSGTLILDNSGTNDFVGAVSIGAVGTLQLGNNDANGNLPAAVSWDDEGTLIFNHANNVLVLANVSGAGSLVQNGSGKLTINTPSSYSGNTVVGNGTLALTGAGTISSTALVFANSGTFDISAAAPSLILSPVALANGGRFIVDTNTVTVGSLTSSNSTIRVVANGSGTSLISSGTLTTGGATNYINLAGVVNVGAPGEIPIISYASANFVGGFNFGLTNFPNAYVTNNAAANTIDVVFLATPYVVAWNGGSSTGNNWSDSNNWSGVSIFANDSLFFDGNTRLDPFNDTAGGTAYSNITFNGTASSFTLTGDPILLTGTMENDSPNPQLVNLGVNFASGGISMNGTAGPLIIGGGLTNTHVGSGFTTNTLMGTGILTNLLASSANGTNLLLINDGAANWTLMDNAASTTNTVPWALALNNGTLNFGSASSAPKFVSTSAQGSPQDNQMGLVSGGTTVLNFSNGLYTTAARFNTGVASGAASTINQYGGAFNIGSQFQGANQTGGSSFVNLYGGTMTIGVLTNLGQFYVSSRGAGTLTITNSALLMCGILDVSRSINGNIQGTVNLDGGTIIAGRVSTATANQGTTPGLATFNFNGGTLKAGASSTTFFQGRTTTPIVPITAIVTVRGAIIDSDTNAISVLEPLLTDPNLVGAPDGGLKKFGTGTLTLTATNTYIGDTAVGAGTLLVNGVQGQSRVIVSNNATLGGNGVIGSNVTVNAGGAVSPGNNGVGALTVAGDVSLAGTTTMEVDKVAGTNDLLLATNSTPSTITYNGTLNVVTVAGSLAPGDTFTLFSASNYVGSFAVINPPNVTWNTNNLNVNGTLTVVSIAPVGPTTNATITKVSLSGTNLLVHGTNNNVPNNTLHYVVLTSTNIATPLSNWAPVLTNIYNGDGTFDFTNAIVPGTPNQFIDIKAVP